MRACPKNRKGEELEINQAKFEEAIRTEGDMIAFMEFAEENNDKKIECLNAIEESDDPEFIAVHIEIFSGLVKEMSDKFESIGYPPLADALDVKADIRNGVGDLVNIQKKCIDMGLV